MLHTTAVSLGDREVGDIAQRHLADYARFVMTFSHLTPAATLRFLQEEGLPARQDVLAGISETIDGVWRDQAKSVPDAARATTGTVR
jgi:hypothetical protein